MRTGLILDWRRTRQEVVQQKFALRVKSRFNPFRDSAGCTIATQWQRRLKSNSSEDQTLLPKTRTRHGSHFLRAFFAGRRISPPSKPKYLRQVERNPLIPAQRFGEQQPKSERPLLPRRADALWEGPVPFRRNRESRKPRSCRAQELARSRAQENERQKKRGLAEAE